MRKLDKSTILSTNYKNWENNLEKNKKNHPQYNSSKGEYFQDIVMNLFNIQKGLCAYTEVFLCNEIFYDSKNWENGKYVCPKEFEKPQFEGHLEHFDESLKSKSTETDGRKDWLWSNFFMVNEHTNTAIKRNKSVEKDDNENYILKPDDANYNEFELLEYDFQTNIYLANRKQSKSLRIKIDKMLEILGINQNPIITKRIDKLKKHIVFIEIKKYNWKNVPFEEFPTMVEMYKQQNNL